MPDDTHPGRFAPPINPRRQASPSKKPSASLYERYWVLSAKIIRAIDETGLLGAGIRVLGTHAIYAYEAVAGVHIDPGLTTTGDVDLLLDSRSHLAFVATTETEKASLLRLLQRIDRSFVRTEQPFSRDERRRSGGPVRN